MRHAVLAVLDGVVAHAVVEWRPRILHPLAVRVVARRRPSRPGRHFFLGYSETMQEAKISSQQVFSC
jgi:hypothetical protein